MTVSYTREEIARAVGGELDGPPGGSLTGVADVERAAPGDVTWVSSAKYVDKLTTSQAGLALVSKDFGKAIMPVVRCANVSRSVAELLALFAPPSPSIAAGIHPTAVIDPTAEIADNCSIGPHVTIEAGAKIGPGSRLCAGVFIGHNSTLGRDCLLWPNVTIMHGCILGDRVIIHSSSVIGADGFGYYFDQGRHNKVPHIGGVRIEDDVEIGACCCVDRAKFGFTVVGKGCKFDNFVQIAHNVQFGEHGLIAAHSGLAGSVRTGPYAVFAGRSGAFDGVTIGSRATVAGGALTAKDVPDGAAVSGVPAQDHRRELRQHAAMRKLPDLMEEVRRLRARVEQLESAANHRP